MRIMRLAAVFASVALIVAAVVGYGARRAQLTDQRGDAVESVAELAAARLGSIVRIAEVAAALGDDPSGAEELLRDVEPLDWQVVAPVGGSTTRLVPSDDGVTVLARGAASTVTVRLDTDDVLGLAGGASDRDGVRARPDVELEVVARGDDVRDGRFTVAAPIPGQDAFVVVASAPASIALPSDERLLVMVVLALAVILLLLAGATLMTDARTLVERASIDPLTRLPNRSEFERRADEVLAAARRTDTGVCMLLFDLDGFKVINDTHGHQAGDDVLR
jgi:hypothetical protein